MVWRLIYPVVATATLGTMLSAKLAQQLRKVYFKIKNDRYARENFSDAFAFSSL